MKVKISRTLYFQVYLKVWLTKMNNNIDRYPLPLYFVISQLWNFKGIYKYLLFGYNFFYQINTLGIMNVSMGRFMSEKKFLISENES